MSPQAMMQPTSTSQVASTHRWMTHHHQYWSIGRFVV